MNRTCKRLYLVWVAALLLLLGNCKLSPASAAQAPAATTQTTPPADQSAANPTKSQKTKSTAADGTSATAAPAAKPATGTTTAPASKPVAAPAAPKTPPANGSGMVWVNTDSGVYHKPGSRYYGKTKQGKYMPEADAIKAGYRAAGRN